MLAHSVVFCTLPSGLSQSRGSRTGHIGAKGISKLLADLTKASTRILYTVWLLTQLSFKLGASVGAASVLDFDYYYIN